jgi:hypothetical protein
MRPDQRRKVETAMTMTDGEKTAMSAVGDTAVRYTRMKERMERTGKSKSNHAFSAKRVFEVAVELITTLQARLGR